MCVWGEGECVCVCVGGGGVSVCVCAFDVHCHLLFLHRLWMPACVRTVMSSCMEQKKCIESLT